MVLQNVIFPSTETCTEEQMYFRRTNRVDYLWCNPWITVHPGAQVVFDTYFNGFCAEKWFKYTKVKNISLTVWLKGNARITLMRKEKTGSSILTEYCGEYNCEAPLNEIKQFSLPFKTASTSGMFCFEITGGRTYTDFFSACYETDLNSEELNPVKIALDICTFKRERFIETNLELLKKRFLEDRESFLYDKLEVFISDNAGTLDQKKLSSPQIHIFKNKNAGGAGGFTRGMIEVKKVASQRAISHVLVMDDDVRIEPESIFRTCTLLGCLKEQYLDAFVGGAMLRLDHQFFQVESGAVWNGGELVSLKHGLDVRDLDACLFNEFEENPQFNAWWYCAFPISVVRDDNLPLPIFIRGDDVEYGLRNIKHLILMNGICVWHEAFENKYSSFLYYYILRNRLIDNSLHNMVLPKEMFQKILKHQVMDEIRLYRYKNANLLMRGVEDFFKGVDWLMEQDGEVLHQSVMAEGYKLQYIEDLEDKVQFNYPLYEASLNAIPATGMVSRLVNHYTLNGTYLSPKKDYTIIPTVGMQQASVYRVQTVLNFDYASKKGFVTRRNPQEAKACVARMNELSKLIDEKYDRVTSQYAEEGQKMMKLKFWKKYLGLK